MAGKTKEAVAGACAGVTGTLLGMSPAMPR